MAKTTADQREAFYRRHIAGETYGEIASDVGVSVGCVRYWYRKLKQGGASQSQYPGRPRGLLKTFAPKIADAVLDLRQSHPRWGPKSIRHQLDKVESLAGLSLPSQTQIGRYLHQWPEFRRQHKRKGTERLCPEAATRVHERWQIDFKLGIALQNGRQVNLHTIRDEVGAVCIDARVTDAGAVGQKARRVTDRELKETLRRGFARWGILPEEVQTDNEVVFVTGYGFPTAFTLWLVGLGIHHRQIRAGHPTDNAVVERCHQTIMNYGVIGNEHLDIQGLQAHLDACVVVLAHEMPSQAKGCQGKPPVDAHPALMRRPLPFLPQGELALFQSGRVHAYLANFTWTRKVGKTGQICIGGQHQYYNVGRAYAAQTVLVRFDPQDQHLVFYLDVQPDQEIRRQPLRNISVADITGLDPDSSIPVPIQMPLPFPVQ